MKEFDISIFVSCKCDGTKVWVYEITKCVKDHSVGDLQILNLLSFSPVYIHNWSHTEASLCPWGIPILCKKKEQLQNCIWLYQAICWWKMTNRFKFSQHGIILTSWGRKAMKGVMKRNLNGNWRTQNFNLDLILLCNNNLCICITCYI